MNFWNNQQTTIASWKSLGQLDTIFNFILANVTNMENDFEIKRLIIGLSTLALSPQSS